MDQEITDEFPEENGIPIEYKTGMIITDYGVLCSTTKMDLPKDFNGVISLQFDDDGKVSKILLISEDKNKIVD